jgi:hypothetical protein
VSGRLNWERSAREVYIKRHGSIPRWVAPLRGSERPEKERPLRETRHGEKIVCALQDAYEPVFRAYVNLNKPRQQERLKEFEDRLRAATTGVRSNASSRTQQTYSTVYESEEKRAIKALKGLRRR